MWTCHVTYRCASCSVIGWRGCCVWRDPDMTSVLSHWQTSVKLAVAAAWNLTLRRRLMNLIWRPVRPTRLSLAVLFRLAMKLPSFPINAQPLPAHRPATDDWQMIGRCPVPRAVPVAISLTADAHFGARLGTFFYWTRCFENNVRSTIPLRFIWSICSGN